MNEENDLRAKYDAAVASRREPDPIEQEMMTLQNFYKALSVLSPSAKQRVLAYLGAVTEARS